MIGDLVTILASETPAARGSVIVEVRGGIVTQLGAQMQRSRLSRDLQGTAIADLPIQSKVAALQHAQDQRQ